MLKKRSNDNAQLSKEEVEDLDDESTEVGHWEKASEDELKSRKILKIKRPSDSNIKSSNPFTALGNAFMTATSAINPFKGLTALAPAPAVSSSSSSSSSSSNNAHNGFLTSIPTPSSLLNTSTINSKVQQTSNTFATNLQSNSFISNPTLASNTLTKPNSIGIDSNESEYKKKMTRLNQSLIQWMDQQLSDNPISIWKDSLKGYITYAKSTNEKYGEKDKVQTFNSAIQSSKPIVNNHMNVTIAPTPAPAPVPAPMFAFSAPVTAPAPVSAPVSAPSTVSAPISFQFGGNTSSTFAAAPVSNIFTTAPPAGSNPFAAINPFTNPSSSGNVFAKTLATSTPFGSIQGASSSGFPSKVEQVNEDEDDEAEPLLEPEQILKNEQDTDEILHDVQCKAYRYSIEDKEWKDMGKGSFRVTRDPITKKQRILIRNTMGRITFNAGFFKAMEFKNSGKGIRFSAVVDATGLKNFNVKFKTEDIPKTIQVLENAVKSLPN